MVLTNDGLWTGYPDGTASLYVGPGAYLRYWRDTEAPTNALTPTEVITFNTSTTEPVAISDVRQIQALLAAHIEENSETATEPDTSSDLSAA